jgi:hypothetical protein
VLRFLQASNELYIVSDPVLVTGQEVYTVMGVVIWDTEGDRELIKKWAERMNNVLNVKRNITSLEMLEEHEAPPPLPPLLTSV